MAGPQERSGSCRILFRYYGKQHTLTLGKVTQDEAEAKSAQADYMLMRLKQQRHSVASYLAAAGVDQRIIDDILGHQSQEMQRRYRHLTL
jgi:site-specific recombinase XerD